jgi:hypothetical protein
MPDGVPSLPVEDAAATASEVYCSLVLLEPVDFGQVGGFTFFKLYE